MKNLVDALVKVQKALKPAIKDSVNDAFKRPGNSGSKYADLTSVWESCREIITANGLCVVQTTDFDGDGAWLKTMLLHTSGEFIEGRFPLRPTKPDMQGMGSALTYARRYGLCAILGIVADVDDDGNAASAPVARYEPEGLTEPPSADRKAAAKKWGEDQLEKLRGFTTKDQFYAWHEKNSGAVGKVRDFNEALHKRLTAEILDCHGRFNPMAS